MAGRRDLEILYEDDCIIVADKPAGLLTMSTGKDGEITAYSILTDYVRSGKHRYSRGKDGWNRIFIVHRLDRDTSGVIVFAKDPETKYALQNDWNDTVLERKYVAVLEGIPEIPEGTIDSYLKDNPKSCRVYSSVTDNGGKYSVTHYRLLSPEGKTSGDRSGGTPSSRTGQRYSLVEFELETGRKNQIRVHAAEIGHPIAGDIKYGALTNPARRLCLHARTLAFRHPLTGKTIRFDTGIPDAFLRLVRHRRTETVRGQSASGKED